MPRATVMAQMMVAAAVTVKYAIVLSFLVLWLLNKVCRIAAGLLNILFFKARRLQTASGSYFEVRPYLPATTKTTAERATINEIIVIIFPFSALNCYPKYFFKHFIHSILAGGRELAGSILFTCYPCFDDAKVRGF